MHNFIFRYAVLYFLYIPVCALYAYNQTIHGDIKIYYDVYNNVDSAHYPFGLEIMLPLLMRGACYFGLSFYDFTFCRLLLWGWVVFRWSYCLNRKGFLIIFIFFLSFCIPPFLNSMMFLAKQSLSLFFCFTSLLVRSRWLKALFVLFMVLSHFGSIIWLLAIFGCGMKVINSKKFILLTLIVILMNYIFRLDFASGFINFLASDIIPLPSVIKDLYATKLGFYLYDQVGMGESLSGLSTVFIVATLGNLYIVINKINNTHYAKITLLYLISTMLLALFYSNDVLANRLGFASYFMVMPFFFFSLFIQLRVKYDKVSNTISEIRFG